MTTLDKVRGNLVKNDVHVCGVWCSVCATSNELQQPVNSNAPLQGTPRESQIENACLFPETNDLCGI